ncbi:hypothetical protein [Streptomyces sp. SBT349]|uniref:hypothetical protein n=1 Tax=Streptomyces sp. SBT349 TaxID=1580539 RepID=UPI00069E8475|nr:hypothetical protein [Streptomyces sp. SBT349]
MADEIEEGQQPATGAAEDPTFKPAPKPGGGDDGLGDPGKKALAEERAARRDAEKSRKELEARLKELEPLAAEAQKAKEARKSETEKLTERASAAEQRAAEAEQRLLRAEVASDKGLTQAQARRLVGATREELEADADELLATFGGKPETDKPKAKTPVERLKPGATPASDAGPADMNAWMRRRTPSTN